MIYHSSEFVFFLVFAIFFYYLTPNRFKVLFLAAASLFWYSTWSVLWLEALLAVFLFNDLLLRVHDRFFKREKRYFFSILIGINIAFFVGLKIIPDMTLLNSYPYGVSFFMTMLLALVIDCQRNNEAPREGMISSMALVFFFPLLVGGPIERGKHFFSQLVPHPRFSLDAVADGGLIFTWGFVKKVFVGNLLVEPLNYLLSQKHSFGSLALLGVLLTFQTYVNFSGFCDMGRGAARCFGIAVPVNFRPFYYAKDPNRFWERWNITIATWMRDYFTMPLMLRFGRRISPLILVFLSFVLIGVWHGISWHWLAFGAFNGALIVIYVRLQSVLRRHKGRLTVAGICLVIFQVAGNGLLQYPNVGRWWRTALRLPPLDFSAFSKITSHCELWILFPAICGLFVFEYFQEYGREHDFYLNFPLWMKRSMVAALFAIFLVLLHFHVLSDYDMQLPLYFRI